MAITHTTLASAAGNTSDPWTTASQAPTSNHLITAAVSVQCFGGGTLPTTVSLSGNGLTWVEIDHQNDTPDLHAIWMFRALGTASSGTVTISQTGGSSLKGANWTFEDWAGTDTTGTNGSGAIVQSAKTLSTSANPQVITVTLASGIGANDAVYLAQSSGSLSTPGGSYTEIVDQAGTDYFMESIWLLPGTTTPSATAATNFQPQVGIAIEIKDAGGGGGSTGWGKLLAGSRNSVVFR